jgi:hypothetical protein
MNHLIEANLSFLHMLEFSGALDFQPGGNHPNDVLTGVKLQLPFGTVPIALGSSFQWKNWGRDNDEHWAIQIYGAVSYQAELVSWPVETTLVVGHTFIEDAGSNIDFGLGFDLILFPRQLRNFLHLLIDYANFSYSADPWGAGAFYRGVLNTGIRIDLSKFPPLRNFNLALDVYMADAFDSRKLGPGEGRSFGTGITFGKAF